MPSLLRDLKYALRLMRKTPGMVALAILTLALGVGANAAIFTVIESVLLRQLPCAHSERLVFIGPGADKPGFASTSWLDYRDIHPQSTLLQDVAGYTGMLGQAVKIGDQSRTVIGVMPETFRFPESMGQDLQKGVWIPLQPTAEMLKECGYHFFNMVAALRPGVTVAQAQHELDAVAYS